MIALSVPIDPANGAASTTASAAPAPAAPSNPGFSQGFLAAGIEQMSTLREWHTALATAIENGIPVTRGMLGAVSRAGSDESAPGHGVAATTHSDRSAYQLLNNEFQSMSKLSDKYVSMRANLTYVAPNALQNDDLNQRIMACGHSLGAVAASGNLWMTARAIDSNRIHPEFGAAPK